MSHPQHFDIAVSCACERHAHVRWKTWDQEACPRTRARHFDCCLAVGRTSRGRRTAVWRGLWARDDVRL